MDWTPSSAALTDSAMAQFMRRQGFDDYHAMWRWSVDDVSGFWRSVWDYFGVEADGDPSTALGSRAIPGARWFPDVRLSYSEHIFRGPSPDAVAIHHASELRGLSTWTWEELRAQTAAVRSGLLAMGVQPGDRVAAYMPNIAETVAAFLATSSLGAVWTSCPPEFGLGSVVDRFGQIEPKVLLTVDGYRYGGRDFDRGAVTSQLRDALPSVQRTVTLPYLGLRGDWADAFPAGGPLAFERVAFDHPLWVLYSSGTTGLPKALVHGHGGILLEHLKALVLHVDARPADRIFWFTTTGWMMWNFLVGALLSESAIVLYDGDPASGGMQALWDLAADASVTTFGTSAAFIHGCMKAGVQPRAGRELQSIRAVGSTGSPLSPEGFDWIHRELGSDTWLFSMSGGSDVCSAFVGGVPVLPARTGELQARALGAAVEAWDDRGRSVVDEVGELVLTEPLPSMPVCLWNDPDGRRYREAYFDTYPGTWRHGDWITITSRGSAVIHGRSDATINRGGVRIGTAEIYRAAATVPEVVDALAVDVEVEGESQSQLTLFVALSDGSPLTSELEQRIASAIRAHCSPRHVPSRIVRAPGIPRTLSGKALELPVKRLLLGADPSEVTSRDALAAPPTFDWFVAYAEAHR